MKPTKKKMQACVEDNKNDVQDQADLEELTNESDSMCGSEKGLCNSFRAKRSNPVLQFSALHPLIEPHGLKCFSAPLVPNVVAQTLPHRDQGDREF